MITASSRSRRLRHAAAAILAGVSLVAGAAAVSTQSPRFFHDDPISREPESQDPSKAEPYEIPQLYEMVYNLFVTPKYVPSGTRARNVNTIDEVPDSSWFTNRVLGRTLTTDEITRGPNMGTPPDPSSWTLIREKTSGAHPGFTARDANGETWFLEFDPKTNPEGATGAVVVATKIFWALGYNQVESFITTFDPKKTTIDPKATVKRPNGSRTPFTHDDVQAILERVAKNPDGTYRVIAGRLIPGKILGNFLYAGTRPDDPNDIVPHQHRRELRALRVFGAWTNLTDLKAANTLDALQTVNGKPTITHYLQDVGSTFGMNNDKHEWDLGYESFYEGNATLKRLVSFGFALSPWQTVDYKEYPSVGKFEGQVFDPRKWRPQTPTTAYAELRADDAFWAARRVAAFTDDMIRAIVHTGQYSDPVAEQHLADTLMKRRDTIARIYMTAINPIVDPRLDASGLLTFANAAVDAGVAKAPAGYRATWSTFDNATGETHAIGETQSASPQMTAPAGLPATPGAYIEVRIAVDTDLYAPWREPVKVYFTRQADGWKLVGIQRTEEK